MNCLATVRAYRVEALTTRSPFGLRYRSLVLNQVAGSLMSSGAALSPRRATYFSLLRQRNLRKRKATLVSAQVFGVRARIRRAYGSPCGGGANAPQRNRCLTPITFLRCSLQAGSGTNSPAAQTSACPDPPETLLLGAYTRVCNAQAGSGWDSKAISSQSIATIFITAHAHSYWARGLKGLLNRPFEDSWKSETRDDRFRSRIYSSTPTVCAEERRARRIRARACLSAASLHETPAGPSTAGRLLGSDTDFAAVHSHRPRRASHRLGEFGL